MLDFLIQMIGTRPIEITAVLCGLANVILIVRRSIWNYPFGFLVVILYALIFFEYQLYSDALLQVYFFFIQIYGLWNWLRHRQDDGRIVVEVLTLRERAIYGAVTVAGWATLATLMGRYTDASFPWWDGAIAALSVLAQFLLSRRKLENWVLWIAVDVLAIGLFWIKGLQPTAALYGVFLVLATMGLLQWLRAWREQRPL
ncbi:nicotinamide riboside transporter PnuC [Jannaschia pohangensis]|uniref:Nicotinamide riboside transporter PnuC n=1 Tax=Jannaschia pohangensis TaxID=390807 RepID=A0A1I3MJ18_9RHOB|nr:nicotinamide riboside transporter PnuC [Jannaschia pohangensis]SFI96932.1 nicotinamide mononucleotide transporter [Jannaschia pohangensis]